MSTVVRIVRMHGGKNSADCKRGTQLTADEQTYITANFRTMTMAAICRHLGRSKKIVRTFARKTGLAPQPTRRVDGDRLVVDASRYPAERAKRVAKATAEVLQLCKAAGIETANTPLSTLALKLVRADCWRPANIHVAANLGGDEMFTPRPASEPCEALPGSIERVEAYAARVERGEEIWCERDRRD